MAVGNEDRWTGVYEELYPGEVEEKPLPVCPVCGYDANTFYLDTMNNEIIGCNVCYDPPEEIDAFQWAEDHSDDSELEERFIERFEVD